MIYPRPILKPKETYSKILQLLHALNKYVDKDIMDKYFDDFNNSKEYIMTSDNHIFCDNYNFCLDLIDMCDNTIGFSLDAEENPKNNMIGFGLSHHIQCDAYGKVISCYSLYSEKCGIGFSETTYKDLLHRKHKKRKVA